jgi:hypothetical protein
MRKWRCALAFLLALPVFGAELKIDFDNSTVNETPAGFQAALAGGKGVRVTCVFPAKPLCLTA